MPHGLDPRDLEGIEQSVQREMEEEEDCLSGNEEQLRVPLDDNPDEDDYYISSDSDVEEEPTELPSNFNSEDDLLNKVFDDRDDAIGAVRDHGFSTTWRSLRRRIETPIITSRKSTPATGQ